MFEKTFMHEKYIGGYCVHMKIKGYKNKFKFKITNKKRWSD
jgi:hypothetical protein